MRDNTYAPVIIPTLNRYEHFKRCLESLEKCTGASFTEVYIGLDYPPSDKYIGGWKQIDEYLKEKENKNGFKSLHVKRRLTNCGVGGPTDNGELLVKEILCEYDRYIFTEDDNEFSPNFLEYVNWGLNTYINDDSIYAICAFKDIDTKDIINNAYKLNGIFSAWGYGTWASKRDKVNVFYDLNYLKQLVCQSKLSDLFTRKVLKISSLLYQIAKGTFHGDYLVSLLPASEKWCIFPKVNKVRNWGWDGSGTHGGSEISFKKYSAMTIDTEEHFNPIVDEDLFNPIVLERFKEKYKVSIKRYFRAVLTFLCFKFIGCIPMSKKKSRWFKVEFVKVC